MNIYDPFAEALGLEPIKLDKDFFNKPDIVPNKWGGSVKGNPFSTGRPKGTFEDYIFVTDGIREKIVHKNNIPKGMTPGRLRKCREFKPVTINGVTYPSGKDAAKALNISPAMVTYLRRKQDTGKRPW